MSGFGIEDFQPAHFSRGETVFAFVVSAAGVIGTVLALAYITFMVFLWWGFQDYEF